MDITVMRVEGSEVVVNVRGEVQRTPLGLLRQAARQDDAELAALYSELVRQADECLARAVRRAVAACSGHSAAHTTEPTCYVGSVSRDENRAAHGGISYREVCRCGAERHVNQNQRHYERGGWYAPRGL